MGTITINIGDETEKDFRMTVKNKKGEGKGKLGESVEEALKKWVEEKKQQDIAQELIFMMEKGWEMGKIRIKSRDELHER